MPLEQPVVPTRLKSSALSFLGVSVELYAIKNQEGRYFRKTGFKGFYRGEYETLWVENLRDAKIYTRPGQAKSQITTIHKNGHGRPAPFLAVLSVTEVGVVPQEERIQQNRKREELRAKRSAVRDKKLIIKQAKEKLAKAQEELERVSGEHE